MMLLLGLTLVFAPETLDGPGIAIGLVVAALVLTLLILGLEKLISRHATLG